MWTMWLVKLCSQSKIWNNEHFSSFNPHVQPTTTRSFWAFWTQMKTTIIISTLYSLLSNWKCKKQYCKKYKNKKTHFRLSKMHFCFWQCHKNWMPHTGKCLHESFYDFLSLEQSVSFHHPWLLSLCHLQLLHHYEANGSWLWKVLRHHIPGQLVSFS